VVRLRLRPDVADAEQLAKTEAIENTI